MCQGCNIFINPVSKGQKKNFMNKLKVLLILLFFSALCINVFAQEKPYPFDAVISGTGSRSIIFIPGFACSGDVWKETQAALEKDFRCYTLTMAGFAGTAPQADRASFRQWEEGIAAYIRNNKIERPVIIGHSMGGGLALAIAADYPDLAAGIVVVDALPCLAAMMNPAFTAKENNDCTAIITQMTGTSEEQFKQMQQRSAQRLVTDSIRQQQIVHWSMLSDRTTFAAMYCDFSNTDLRGKLTHITCPALILLEPYFKSVQQQIAKQYEGLATAQLHYANKGLHFIMYDDPDWYMEELKTFLTAK